MSFPAPDSKSRIIRSREIRSNRRHLNHDRSRLSRLPKRSRRSVATSQSCPWTCILASSSSCLASLAASTRPSPSLYVWRRLFRYSRVRLAQLVNDCVGVRLGRAQLEIAVADSVRPRGRSRRRQTQLQSRKQRLFDHLQRLLLLARGVGERVRARVHEGTFRPLSLFRIVSRAHAHRSEMVPAEEFPVAAEPAAD